MNLSIKLTQKYEFSRINIDMRKPEISQYRNPQYMPKGENKLKMKMMKWINTIDLNTKSCNMPSSNVALSSCRTQCFDCYQKTIMKCGVYSIEQSLCVYESEPRSLGCK